MKKIFKIFLFVLVIFSLTACKDNNANNTNNEVSKKDAFYESLPLPSDKIDKTVKNEKLQGKIEYIMYINDYSYAKFHDYIISLEKLGFNYEFVKEAVPEKVNDLQDKTETSWGANNGKIWIRALWRSKENAYYSDYNLQLIFNNYNYLEPVESVQENKDEVNETKQNQENEKVEEN